MDSVYLLANGVPGYHKFSGSCNWENKQTEKKEGKAHINVLYSQMNFFNLKIEHNWSFKN